MPPAYSFSSTRSRAWTTGAYETPLAGGRLRINGAYMLTPAEVEIYDRYVGANGLEYEYDDIDRMQAELERVDFRPPRLVRCSRKAKARSSSSLR